MFTITNIVTVIVWIFIITTVLVVLYKPKSRLARTKNIQEILESSKLSSNKFLRVFNPFSSNEENRFNVNITTREYWMYFIIGQVVSLVFVVGILRIWFAVPLTILFAMALPTFMQFLKRRKHKTSVYSDISTYISTTANLSMTFGNPLTAYKEILNRKYIAEPMYSDIERMVLMIESNIPLNDAFKEFERKYGNISHLRLFHQNLVIMTEQGGDQSQALFQTSAEYDEMLAKRQIYFQDKQKEKKDVYMQAGMALIAPIAFLVVMFDYYSIFLEHLTGRIILLMIAIVVILSVLQSEREVNKDIFR